MFKNIQLRFFFYNELEIINNAKLKNIDQYIIHICIIVGTHLYYYLYSLCMCKIDITYLSCWNVLQYPTPVRQRSLLHSVHFSNINYKSIRPRDGRRLSNNLENSIA